MDTELINIISEIFGILLFAALTIGLWLGIFQDLNLRKKYHDKEVEKIELEIKRLQNEIDDNDAITNETLKQLRATIKIL